MKIYPYGKQNIDDDDIKAVVDVLRSDYLTTGPKIDEFEKALAKKVNSKYAVAFSNGTAALHAAYYCAGITKGDEVITTPLTFAATANAALYLDAKPVFCDVDEETYCIDASKLEKLITENTKAIVPVHYMGSVSDMDTIIEIANKHNLVVIEDAAHALGASYKDRKIGSVSDMTIFSFHPVKTITTGEGGAVTTNSLAMYEKLKLFRTHGIRRENMSNNDMPAYYYEQDFLGYNYRLTDIQCALGLSQLTKLDTFIDQRMKIARLYDSLFESYEGLTRPHISEGAALHLYVVRLKLQYINVDRDTIYKELRDKGILVNVHYIPVYWHPYYRSNGYDNTKCEVAEDIFQSILTLPLYPGLESNDIEYIVRIVKETIENHRK